MEASTVAVPGLAKGLYLEDQRAQAVGIVRLCPGRRVQETPAEVSVQSRDAQQESGQCAHRLKLCALPVALFHYPRFLLVGEMSLFSRLGMGRDMERQGHLLEVPALAVATVRPEKVERA